MRSAVLLSLSLVLRSLAQTPHAAPPPGGSYIGVMMQEVDGERAKTLKLSEVSGVELTLVEADGPAGKAGLKVGDVVLRYNGQKVEGNEQFARLVRETPAGREVKIDISRGGAPQTVMVRIGLRKAPRIDWSDGNSMPGQIQIHLSDIPRLPKLGHASILGVEAEPIDGQLAQYFGVGEGVLVRSVLKGSSAERAGVRAGDVILRIEETHVATPADISNRLRTIHGKPVAVSLMRDHKEMTLSVMISDNDPDRIEITPFQVPNH
jgi:serine protease Do